MEVITGSVVCGRGEGGRADPGQSLKPCSALCGTGRGLEEFARGPADRRGVSELGAYQ